MKAGDMVKFHERFRKSEDLYLVCERHKTWDWERFDCGSPFAAWVIVNCATGKIHTQTARDLEVISETIN